MLDEDDHEASFTAQNKNQSMSSGSRYCKPSATHHMWKLITTLNLDLMTDIESEARCLISATGETKK